MKKTFYIQNMVCDRCKSAVKKLIKAHQVELVDLELGRAVINTSSNFDVKKFSAELKENGFYLIKNPDEKLVEQIKVALLKMLNNKERSDNFSIYLANNLYKDYSVLSKTFRKIEGETIEKYLIKLKIEKVKEFIQMQNRTFSEIADELDYNNISHLSSQFKSLTGMTMSEYQSSQDWNRHSIDKIL